MALAVKRFLPSAFFAVALAVALIVMIIREEFKGVLVYYLSTGYLLSLVLQLWGEEVKQKTTFWTVSIVSHLALIVDSAILWQMNDDDLTISVGVAHAAAVAALVLCLVFLPFFREKDDEQSWNFLWQLLGNAAIVALVSVIMTGGCCILIAGFGNLFDVDIKDKVYFVVVTLFLELLPMLVILLRIPYGEKKHMSGVRLAKFFYGVIRYLIIPLVLCYILVLYGYLGKILVTWQLPDGAVSWLVTIMMIGIIGIIFMLYPDIHGKTIKRFEAVVVRWLPIAALPLLVLMTVGVVRRFDDYGVTANRLYVLTANVWFYIVAIGLWLVRCRRIHWVALSFGLILLLSSSQPFNYYEIARHSMTGYIQNAVDAHKPKHLPMNGVEFDEWIRSLTAKERKAVATRMKELEECSYDDDLSRWVEKPKELLLYQYICDDDTFNDSPCFASPNFPYDSDTIAHYLLCCETVDIPSGAHKMQDLDYCDPVLSDSCLRDSVLTLPVSYKVRTADNVNAKDTLYFYVSLAKLNESDGLSELIFDAKDSVNTIRYMPEEMKIQRNGSLIKCSHHGRLFFVK